MTLKEVASSNHEGPLRGPLLFSIFVINLPDVLQIDRSFIYAEDSKVYSVDIQGEHDFVFRSLVNVGFR